MGRMKRVTVAYLHPQDGPTSDTFDGDTVSFVTEPSGALVIFQRPGEVWAAFGAGAWWQVSIGDAPVS